MKTGFHNTKAVFKTEQLPGRMVKVNTKKISIMSVNFLKIIFNDKCQAIFRIAV